MGQARELAGVTAIAGGENHTVAVRKDGTVWAWGRNSWVLLENGEYTTSKIPTKVTNLEKVVAVAGGSNHTIILKSDGRVWTWGENRYGQLGNEETSEFMERVVPAQVKGIGGVIAIAGNYEHSVALKSDGTVWTWGNNSHGQLGNGKNTNSNIPVPVSGLEGVIAIAGGRSYTIAIRSDNTIWAWGNNGWGQLGNNENIGSNIPIQIKGFDIPK